MATSCLIERLGGVGVDCDNATATPALVLVGQTFGGATSEELLTGEMPNKGTTNYTITENGGYVTVEEGQHSGSGKVTYQLPSVVGGTTLSPVALGMTVALANKYLRNNISVAGSANLIAKNVLKGKNIWGVNGSHINMDLVNQIYDGSAFYGFLNKGVINYPTAGGNPVYTGYSTWNNAAQGSAITSGSLFSSGELMSTAYPSFLVSARSIDFSLFSTLRITGYFTANGVIFGRKQLTAYSTLTIKERTNVSGATQVIETSAQHTDTLTMTGTGDEGNHCSGSQNFDISFDISAWTETNAFLELNAVARRGSTGTSQETDWRGMILYITGIYIS